MTIYQRDVEFSKPFPRTNGLSTLSKATIKWSVRYYSFLHFYLFNRSVLLIAPKDMVFSLMVLAANSHVGFLWSVLIFFHPFRGQVMVVPSNLRISFLSQLRRAGGTRFLQSNYKILRALRWIVTMFPTSGGLLKCISQEERIWVGLDCSRLGMLRWVVDFPCYWWCERGSGFGGRVVGRLVVAFGVTVNKSCSYSVYSCNTAVINA